MSAGENISIITISLVRMNNVSMYDDDLTDVTCAVSLYITVGIMINKYSDPLQRSITFEYTQPNNDSFPYDLRSYILKIEYLKSYENVGKVIVKVCGHQIGKIDALDGLHAGGFHPDSAVKKVSIPDIRLYNGLHIKCPTSYLTENKFSVELVYIHDDDRNSRRKTAKFKILSINVCVPMEAIELGF